MKRIGKWAVFVLLICVARVAAQEATCPEIVQAALDATDEQCSATARNQACYGNVNLQATPQPGVSDFDFSAPGDIVGVSSIGNLRLESRVEETGEWGVALMQLQANIPDTSPGQNVTFLLFGDVQITNGVESNTDPVTFDVTAQGNINVLAGPSNDDEPVGTLSDGETMTAVGRSDDGDWLHVSQSGVTGWVAADEVEMEGDIQTLNIIDPATAGFAPMQAFYFQSGIGDAPCAEAPDSGILVQTPEGVSQIQFTVNDVNITLGSTAYLQAQPGGDMTASVIEGQATVEVGGASEVVPEGSFVSVPLDAQGRAAGAPSQPQPYDPAKMAVLPVRILPRTITIANPISVGGAAIIPAAGEWQWTNGTPTQEGCPAGVVALVVPTFTPRGPFRLPGDDFSLIILFDAAFGQSTVPPGAEFSNPDANTYVVDFSDGGGNGHYEVRVIDAEHIQGQLQYSSQGCTMAIPFEITGESGAGIIPAAGEWEWIVGEPSSEGCQAGTAETLVTAMDTLEPFRLPGDEFSLDILLEAASRDFFSLPNGVYSNPDPNTYVVEYGGGSTANRYTVRVVDTDHIEGQFDHTFEGCSATIPFEVTRIGD